MSAYQKILVVLDLTADSEQVAASGMALRFWSISPKTPFCMPPIATCWRCA
jgi:hypothetical protein